MSDERNNFKSSSPLWLFGVALLGAIVAGIFIVRWYRETPDVAPKPRPVVAAAPDAGIQVAPHVDLAEGDRLAAQGLRELGNDPQLASWAEQGGLVRRIAGAVQLVADGDSPRPVLSFMQPKRGFGVERKNGKLYMSAASASRYDDVTRALASVDARAAGRLYATLSDYLESAYAEIAPQGKHFDAGFKAAVDRLAAVPVSDEPVEVEPMQTGVGWAFADPKLEKLKPAEKHLLRMGPKNAKTIVKQLKAFEAAAFPGT